MTSILWLALSNLTASLWWEITCSEDVWYGCVRCQRVIQFGSGWGEVEVVFLRTLYLLWSGRFIPCYICKTEKRGRFSFIIWRWRLCFSTMAIVVMYDGVMYEMFLISLLFFITIIMHVYITIIKGVSSATFWTSPSCVWGERESKCMYWYNFIKRKARKYKLDYDYMHLA